MSGLNQGIRYYLLVVVVGLLAAALSIAFYLLYLLLSSLRQRALEYSTVALIPLAFLAIGLPYLLVNYFAKTKTTGSGTHTVLEAYHLTNGELPLKDTIVKPAAAMLTIGLGGSAGPEGPSLFIGGGVASALSKYFKIKADHRRRLFLAGAAAALAATFRTPFTAILFALEIPYKNDLEREIFIEAALASVPAYLLSVAVFGGEPLFGVVANTPLPLYEIGLSLLLGLICGLYAVFFTKTFSWIEKLSFKIKKKAGAATTTTIAALVLISSGLISIYTIGVGLDFVRAIIQGAAFNVLTLTLIMLLKAFATITTLNFGGSGGLFFPTIVVGAGIGYIFSTSLNVSVNFTVMFIAIGMAALLAGTHKVLLTPVAFIIETLGGIFAIPALLASGVSYLVSGNNSFYSLQPRTRLKTEELALERFYLEAKKLIPEKLDKITVSEIMTKNPVVIYQGATVKEALETFEGTKLRVMPIIDDDRHVLGVVNLENLGCVDLQRRGTRLSETVIHRPTLIKKTVSLQETAKIMIEEQQDHIFVINEHQQLEGVVSGIDIIKKIIELLS
ncbi:MAG: chloride channel protein [Candidatus Brockarchaeota archaeon]|nr:chloride channel protein [Candidatus Brockarchaeota archaeon]MBS7631384.1 chloride channel protein [Candidatus Bathyarchaeota archaeon]